MQRLSRACLALLAGFLITSLPSYAIDHVYSDLAANGYSISAIDSLDLLPSLPDTAAPVHFALTSTERFKHQPIVGTERDLYPTSVRLSLNQAAATPVCPHIRFCPAWCMCPPSS